MNPILATVLTLTAAVSFLRIMDLIAHKGLISSRFSRKVIHIGTGPIFVLCWLMFPDVWYARYLAALVPGMITVQFALTGLGIIKDEASVKAMSRSGDPKEILRGPLFYGVMFVLLTILFWKDNPAGVVALMMLCGGDGIADLVGRGIPSAKLPWSQKKSVAGTMSVFVGGLLFALAVLWVFHQFGVFAGAYTQIGTLASIAAVATLVESLPYADIDNLTISLLAAGLAWWWM